MASEQNSQLKLRLTRRRVKFWRPKIVHSYGQEPPKCSEHNPTGPHTECFIHYSASDGEGIDKRGEPRQAMLNIQHHHQVVNGWCDTAYSYVVFQPRGVFKRPVVFKGRGFGQVPASQEGRNTGHVSICVVADSNDRIKRATFKCIAYLIRRSPARHVRAHKDVSATACPGRFLDSKVPQLDQAAKKRKWKRLP